jgi:hypothetical protein
MGAAHFLQISFNDRCQAGEALLMLSQARPAHQTLLGFIDRIIPRLPGGHGPGLEGIFGAANKGDAQ